MDFLEQWGEGKARSVYKSHFKDENHRNQGCERQEKNQPLKGTKQWPWASPSRVCSRHCQQWGWAEAGLWRVFISFHEGSVYVAGSVSFKDQDWNRSQLNPHVSWNLVLPLGEYPAKKIKPSQSSREARVYYLQQVRGTLGIVPKSSVSLNSQIGEFLSYMYGHIYERVWVVYAYSWQGLSWIEFSIGLEQRSTGSEL